jgi:hypothetical protein
MSTIDTYETPWEAISGLFYDKSGVNWSKMATKAKIDPLKGSGNWNIWRIRLKALLSEKEIGYTIKPKRVFPKGTDKDDIEEYTEKRKSDSEKATAIIRLNISDSPLIQTANIADDDAEGLYNRLEALFAPRGFSTEFILAKELFETTLERSGNSIERYLTRIRSYTDELALRNKPIPKAIIAAYTLNNLTDMYSPLITAITTKYRENSDNKEIDLDDLFNAIIDEARRQKSKEPVEAAAITISSAKRRSKSTITCYKCQKKGHYARECREKPKEPKEALEAEENEEMASIVI